MGRAPALLLGAAAFALAELFAGLILSDFAVRRTAAPHHFHDARPWLLLLMAIAAASLPLGARWPLYAVALAVAGSSEAIFLWALGEAAPGAVLRGLGAGGAMLLLLDVAVQLGRAASVRYRWLLPAALGASLLALPGPIRWFDMMARGTAAAPPVPIRVAMISGLPLGGGERGFRSALGLPPRGATEVYRLLEERFDLQEVAAVTPESVQRRDVLLVVQPRKLSAYDLAALDRWVRAGGQALFFLDPASHWADDDPEKKARAPGGVEPIHPLLDHWGLSLAVPKGQRPAPVDHSLDVADRAYRVRLYAPGRFGAADGRCRLLDRALIADCAIGKGRAILLADVDLFRDALWVGDDRNDVAAETRADNGAYVVRRIEDLAGVAAPAVRPAPEFGPTESHRLALVLALLPIAFALALSLIGAASARGSRDPSPRG